MLLFQNPANDNGLIFLLPVIMYMFVVVLGTDYNILIITRLREEAASLMLAGQSTLTQMGFALIGHIAWWPGHADAGNGSWQDHGMPETDETPDRVRRFAAGATAVRRDVLQGKVWTAAPMRVVHDRPGELLLAHWPGIEGLASTIQIEALLTGDAVVRKLAIPALAEGRWELGRWTWRDTLLLTWLEVDEDFGVCRFFRAESGQETWYINFQRPYRRTGIGVDTFDLLLDLVVAPDRSRWDWKDEDEYAQGRRLGLIGDAEHRRIERARDRAVALVESGGGPLAQDWSAWQVSPSWPYPALPKDTLEVPAA